MKRPTIFILAASVCTSACTTTTSFAPPNIPIRQRTTDTTIARDCAPVYADPSAAISHDVGGALDLIDNFVNGYRCSMRAAADGRQPWEILSFLSLVGSAAAVALGAGRDVAVVGGMGGSIFNAGRGYYDPQEQTEILSSAVDGLLCIQSEAAGISAFDSTVERRSGQTGFVSATGGSVEVSVERQYFNMVSSALLSIERVAAQRLSRRGSFDAAGVAAEIRQLAEEAEEASDAADDPPAQDPSVATLHGEQIAAAARQRQLAELRLEELRPRLQQCVVRAKV